ncbi:OmcA/MtrC family decaheme c-type cytochrome [Myxococcota bacterium]|nr:OmcA/MtrC family decaheme c-type cytochrome [Myxococcota bacterium]
MILIFGAACGDEDGSAGQTDAGPSGGDSGPGGAIFTDPGLALELQSASIEDGRAVTTFRITDPDGVPLDREGLRTEGEVQISFVLAWLGTSTSGPGFYTAYTTRAATSTRTGLTTDQAAADSGGTFEELAAGTYRYTFATTATVTSPMATHRVAAWATRTRGEQRDIANAELDFVPAGGAVMEQREIVSSETCDRCHNEIEAHGGARRRVELCITCHSPQTIDPDTGNTVDFPVMIHKIHMGERLPSVEMGTPYQIIGFRGSVHDYSTVVFPENVARCESCHANAEDAEVWRTGPSTRACVTCHDDIVFTEPVPPGKRLHSGGTQPNDAMCDVCHAPSGSIAGITDTHYRGYLDPDAPKVGLSMLGLEPATAGMPLTIRFDVTIDDMPVDLTGTATQAMGLTALRATIAGPNEDYASYQQATIFGAGASGTLTPVGGEAGVYTYTFPQSLALPANARGSWTVGLEGYIQVSAEERYAAFPPVATFVIGGGDEVPRRRVVSQEKCDACHFQLQAHGGTRRNVQYCTLCHNPNNVGDERAPRLEADATIPGVQALMPGEIEIESVALARMIHRIHMGEELTRPYVLGGFPLPSQANPAGTPVDFSEVRFPGDIADCATCHVEETHQLPLPETLLPTIVITRQCTERPEADADQLCQPQFLTTTSTTVLQPATAACTGCHDSPAALAHALVNTAPNGLEACATCHGPGGEEDVDVVHGLR